MHWYEKENDRLKKGNEMYNLREEMKKYEDHKLPSVSYFDVGQMNEAEKKRFMHWYEKENDRLKKGNEMYNLHEEMKKYEDHKLPSVSYFDIGQMNEAEKKRFMHWYEKENDRLKKGNEMYNLHEEMKRAGKFSVNCYDDYV